MNVIPSNVLNDLYLRFLQNIEDFSSIFRVIENMYWFYLDQFYVKDILPNIDLIDFTTQVFNTFPNIKPHGIVWEEEFDAWKAKKSKTPTASAIIIDESYTMIIMVKGFDFRRWMFPGGKKEEETFRKCAIREVDEEIGFDISNLIDDNLCINVDNDGVHRCHYIICGVDLSTVFKPKTNYEIEKITWFPLEHLPESKSDDCYPVLKVHAREFVSLMHVIKIIKRWVTLVKTTGDKAKALAIATDQVDRGNSSARCPRSHTLSDTRSTEKNSILNRSKNKMFTVMKNEKDDFPWPIFQLNKDEFIAEFSRQMLRQ